jgi:hypothetical protein
MYVDWRARFHDVLYMITKCESRLKSEVMIDDALLPWYVDLIDDALLPASGAPSFYVFRVELKYYATFLI